MGGKDDGRKAAREQARANIKGINEQRRQFDFARGLLDPYVSAGTEMLPTYTGGATLAGFGQNLDEILNSGVLDPLREKRLEAINTQFAKNGMFNSGGRATAIANDLTDFSLGIEQLLNGRQGNIVNAGQNAAAGLGGFGQHMGDNISQLHQNTGAAMASGRLADAQAEAQMWGQLLGMGSAAAGGAMAGGAQGAGLALMFSDSKLKTDIRKIGEIGPLNFYQWEWVPELEAVGIEPDMHAGFLAEDVEQYFPEFVHPVGPYKAVDYEGLINKLDEVIH